MWGQMGRYPFLCVARRRENGERPVCPHIPVPTFLPHSWPVSVVVHQKTVEARKDLRSSLTHLAIQTTHITKKPANGSVISFLNPSL